MRILANENFPLDAVVSLRTDGHDVLWVRTEAPGISDVEVLDLARRDNRLIVTFDKDFGELAFHAHLPLASGIILFRLRAASAAQIAKFVSSVLMSRDDWLGSFAVIDNFRIRIRPLPSREIS
jgi:predicted nuclease of predicted toxin-antitoxin system